MDAKTATDLATTAINHLGMVDQLQQVMTEISKKLVAMTPSAAHLLLSALQLRAILTLVILWVSFIPLTYLVIKVALFIQRAFKEGDVEFHHFLVCFIFLPWLGVVSNLLTVQIWIMAISPQAGLALQIFDKITGGSGG